MHRALALSAAAVCAALLVLPSGFAPGSSPTFGEPVRLPSAFNLGEPSVAVGQDGTLYVVAPASRTNVYRSTDLGASFVRVHDSYGNSGDSDAAVTPDGTLYVSDLFNYVPVSVSTSKGAAFEYTTYSMPTDDNGIDRQWLAAPADGVVFSAVKRGGVFQVSRSVDAAKTWTTVNAFGDATFPPPGQMIAPTANDVFVPYLGTNGYIRLAVSHDGGASFTSHNVATTPTASLAIGLPPRVVLFPSVAMGDDGTLYVAWADNGENRTVYGTRARVSHSTDGGVTWSSPVTLSPPATNLQGNYHIFPWVVAGAAGKVAVAWYEGEPPAGARTSENAAAGTLWYVRVAYSANANAPDAAWTSERVTPFFWVGPICTMGTACFPYPYPNPVFGNRILLDFFEMDKLPDGRLVISYPGYQASPISPAVSATQLLVMVQNGGPTLS